MSEVNPAKPDRWGSRGPTVIDILINYENTFSLIITTCCINILGPHFYGVIYVTIR